MDKPTQAQIDAALPELIELARRVAKGYTDSADWKDARSRLYGIAYSALLRLGIDADEDDEDA